MLIWCKNQEMKVNMLLLNKKCLFKLKIETRKELRAHSLKSMYLEVSGINL